MRERRYESKHEDRMRRVDASTRMRYHPQWRHVSDGDGDWYWQVRLREIPSLVGMGGSRDEAADDLRERFEDYVRWRLDMGLDVPQPLDGEE